MSGSPVISLPVETPPEKAIPGVSFLSLHELARVAVHSDRLKGLPYRCACAFFFIRGSAIHRERRAVPGQPYIVRQEPTTYLMREWREKGMEQGANEFTECSGSGKSQENLGSRLSRYSRVYGLVTSNLPLYPLVSVHDKNDRFESTGFPFVVLDNHRTGREGAVRHGLERPRHPSSMRERRCSLLVSIGPDQDLRSVSPSSTIPCQHWLGSVASRAPVCDIILI